MKKLTNIVFILLSAFFLAACCCDKSKENQQIMSIKTEKTWEEQLDEVLPLLGHRNWILVVDKAFPLQSAAGMTYINTNGALLDVLGKVTGKIKSASHVAGIYYTDAELGYISEDLVPGIDTFKKNLQQALAGNNIQTLNHNDVFKRLDDASKLFNVVVLKTEQVMPYTSVFIELDCGYWSADKEAKLRTLMQ